MTITALRRTTRRLLAATAASPLISLLASLLASLLVAAPLSATPSDTTRSDGRSRRPAGPSVGVLPFDATARDTVLAALSYALPDLLTTDLARSAQLLVLERVRLGAVLRELDLIRAGGIDSATAPRVGQLLNARYLVVGRVRRGGPRTLVFDTRLTDAETARGDATMSTSASLDDVLAAEKELAFRLLDQLGIVLTPRERMAIEERPTRNLGALLAYGQGVEAEINGQYALAARAFQRATVLDPRFAGAVERLRAVRALLPEAARRSALERVNRPLESIPSTLLPGLAIDPAFSGAQARIVVTINHD
ncbi:MAG: CsgG/HfaB family protein [Gemmatirosa sp.]